ncbi:lipopolysaccharide assembly protein LapA domain-containing protein [Franzmannia qiaohouensis]|uniref:Lipopolysaccharide assembly protein LapA domain-containing protein n=1 Tax=Franzmannia qiaohouensis TaxID=1329370 RepID=A0ABU1HFA4_9GAMM|nr:lipopolysaccharide assembly protein LapA domain-containing protein [Halomonas qiaohouensis]MDR5906144.1 lipopolysaccharide assembly protein LapA domain-containing protein [Halomonas qiaohouensis]
MDKVYLILKILITLIVMVLFVQNIRVVEVNFLAWSLSLPLALLLVVVYVLGMVSGKSLMALVRRLRASRH